MAKNRYTRRKLLKYDIGGEIGGGLDQLVIDQLKQLAETGSFTGFGTGKDYGIASGPTGSRNNKYSGWGKDLALSAATGATSNMSSTNSAVTGLVNSAIYSIPMIGSIASAAQSITGPIGEAIGSGDETNFGAQTAEAWLNPINNISEGLGNLISGDEPAGESLMQLGSGLLPGFTILYGSQQADKGKKAKDKREEEQLRQTSLESFQKYKQDNPGNFRETSGLGYAAYGGRLSMYQAGGFTDYQTGQKHGQSSMDGIPVDSIGNPSANSGRPATGLTERNEVTYNGYVFSDQLYI